jgi:hypothetical protein
VSSFRWFIGLLDRALRARAAESVVPPNGCGTSVEESDLKKTQQIGSSTDAFARLRGDHRIHGRSSDASSFHRQQKETRMTHRRTHKLGSTIATAMKVLALVSVARRIGPRRIGHVAALATAGYINQRRRGHSHR